MGYLDLQKYGPGQTDGYGIGLERTLLYFLGEDPSDYRSQGQNNGGNRGTRMRPGHRSNRSTASCGYQTLPQMRDLHPQNRGMRSNVLRVMQTIMVLENGQN
jgi:hypothetical protein